TALISDTASITPYVSGVGLSGTPVSMTFQSIDLDAWASAFLEAVDLFLSPSYAVPAWAQDAADFATIVTAKRTLANAISVRVRPILGTSPAPPAALADAQAALLQAMFVRLSTAYSVNSLAQVPVSVTSHHTNAATAPRLFGKTIDAGGT